jgi:hypothetical protein
MQLHATAPPLAGRTSCSLRQANGVEAAAFAVAGGVRPSLQPRVFSAAEAGVQYATQTNGRCFRRGRLAVPAGERLGALLASSAHVCAALPRPSTRHPTLASQLLHREMGALDAASLTTQHPACRS